MRTILCFGDSNTWGVVPNENRRYSISERWPGLLAQSLPPDWQLVENGQPGRTSIYEDTTCGFSCGLTALTPVLEKYLPDFVIVMLGTNDLKTSFGLSAEDISLGVAKLVEEIRRFGCARSGVLLVAPPPILPEGSFSRLFFSGNEEKSKQLASYYQQRAKELECGFFDAGKVVQACPREGVHWLAEQHIAFAQAIKHQLFEKLHAFK